MSTMNEFNRTSPEYLNKALDQAFAAKQDIISGVKAQKAPESYDDLVAVADATRNPCGISEVVDEYVGVLAEHPNRDELVRRLPYDPEYKFVSLILPSIELFNI